jgi:dihydrofolate reductase
MPELLIGFITSLDGYAAADGWPGWWGLEGPEYLAWLAESPEADYTVLMGANTYRLMSGFAAAGEPGTDALAGLSKVVFSTALREAEWANTQLVAQDPVESVRAMKDEGTRPMRTIGSVTLCRSLLEAGLVATRQLEWHARCHGSGRRSDTCPQGIPTDGLDQYAAEPKLDG